MKLRILAGLLAAVLMAGELPASMLTAYAAEAAPTVQAAPVQRAADTSAPDAPKAETAPEPDADAPEAETAPEPDADAPKTETVPETDAETDPENPPVADSLTDQNNTGGGGYNKNTETSGLGVTIAGTPESGYQRTRLSWSVQKQGDIEYTYKIMVSDDLGTSYTYPIEPASIKKSDFGDDYEAYIANKDLPDPASEGADLYVRVELYTKDGKTQLAISNDHTIYKVGDSPELVIKPVYNPANKTWNAMAEIGTAYEVDEIPEITLYFKKSDEPSYRSTAITMRYASEYSLTGTLSGEIAALGTLAANTTYQYYTTIFDQECGTETEPKEFSTGDLASVDVSNLFVDEDFRDYVKHAAGIRTYDPISLTQLEGLTELNCSNKSSYGTIQSIKGIEYISNLTKLNLTGHEIVDASPLSGLTKLTNINFSNNKLTALPNLSSLASLTDANFENNQMLEETITADKLPSGFKTNNPDWITNTTERQRKSFNYKLAQKYYTVGAKKPFVIQVKDLVRNNRKYTLSFTANGKTASQAGLSYNDSGSGIYYIEDISSVGITVGTPVNANIKITDDRGDTWLDITKPVTFAVDEGAPYTEKISTWEGAKKITESIGIYGLPGSFDIKDLETVYLQDKNGNKVGTLSEIGNTNDDTSGIYKDDLGYFSLEGVTLPKRKTLYVWIAFSKYLQAGEYHIVLKMKGKDSIILQEPVECIAGNPAIIEQLHYADRYDQTGKYLYIWLFGKNIDPKKVWPVFKKDGKDISRLISAVKADDYGSDYAIYKLEKLDPAANWTVEKDEEGNDQFLDQTYEIAHAEGYTVIDNIPYGGTLEYPAYQDPETAADKVQEEYYVYKQESIQVKLKEGSIANGTSVRVSVSGYTTTATVQNGWLSLIFRNAQSQNVTRDIIDQEWGGQGLKFTYTYDSKTFTHKWNGRWIGFGSSYNPGGFLSGGYLYQTEAKIADLCLPYYDTMNANLNGNAAILYKCPYSGREIKVKDLKLSLADSTNKLYKLTGTDGKPDNDVLAEGKYKIYYSYRAQNGNEYPNFFNEFYVYDEAQFYMRGQTAKKWVENGSVKGIEVSFASINLLEAYIRNKYNNVDGTAYWNNENYKLEIFDRLGNLLKTVGKVTDSTAAVTASESLLTVKTSVPAGYTGYFVRITKNGNIGQFLGEGKSYYAWEQENWNREDTSEEKGTWCTLEDQVFSCISNQDIGKNDYCYAIGTDTLDAYPLTILLTEPGVLEPVATITATDPTTPKKQDKDTGTEYYFTTNDLKDIKRDRIYKLLVLNKNGDTISRDDVGHFNVWQDNSTPPSSITLTPTTLRLNKGRDYYLSATVGPVNAANKTVSWESDNSKVATVDAQGKVIAMGAGTATITATANGNTALEKTCKVTVTDYQISERDLQFDHLDKRSEDDVVELTRKLSITGKAPTDTVTWKSTNSSVATVTAGAATAGGTAVSATVTAKGIGGAVILAEIKDGTKVVAILSCDVTVENNVLTEIALNESACLLTIEGGKHEEKQLFVYKKPSNTTATGTITWESSDTEEKVVNLTPGEDGSACITAVGAGTATITARWSDYRDSIFAECTVTVKSVTTQAEAEAAAKSLNLSALTNVQTALKDITLPDGWAWENGETKLGTAVGTRYFPATYTKPDTIEGYTINVPVFVATISGMKIDAKDIGILNMQDKKEGTLSILWTKNGSDIDLTEYVEDVTWTSKDEGVATVEEKEDGTATVTAQAKGSTTITLTAKVGSKTYTATYTVKVIDTSVAEITLGELPGILANSDAGADTYNAEVKSEAEENKGNLTVTVENATSLTVKSSDPNVIAAGSVKKEKAVGEDNTYTMTIPLTVKAAGVTNITLTANDTQKTTKTITVNVTDPTPSISAEIVTLNLAKTVGTEFTLYPHEGYKVTDATLANVLPTSSDAEKFELETKEVDGALQVTVTAGTDESNAAKKNTSYKVLVVPTVTKGEEPADSATIPLTIKAVETKPSYRVSQSGKVNLFYTDSKAELKITTAEPLPGVSLDGCDYTVVEDGDKYYLKKDAAESDTKKGTLTLTFEGYNPVSQSFTVATETKAPALALSSKAATFYPGANTAVIDVTKDRVKWDLSEAMEIEAEYYKKGTTQKLEGFTAEKEGEQIKITVPESVTTQTAATIKISIKGENWDKPLKLDYTATVKPSGLAVKLSKTTLKLNVNDAFYQKLTDQTDVLWKDGADFESENVDSVAVQGKDAKAKALLDPDDKKVQFACADGAITAQLLQSGVAKGRYNFEVIVKVSDEVEVKTPLTLNVVDEALAPKLNKTTLRLNTAFWSYDMDTADVTYKDKDSAGFLEEDIKVYDANTDAMQKKLKDGIEFAYDKNKQTVTAKLLRSDVPNGTYKFKLRVPVNNDNNYYVETPFSVKVVSDAPAKAITVSQKGTIDVLNREGTFVTVTPTLKAVNGKIQEEGGVKLTGIDAHLFTAKLDTDSKGKQSIIIKAKTVENPEDPEPVKVELLTKYDYKVKLLLTLESESGYTTKYETPELKIRLKQGSPRVSITPAGAQFYSGIESLINRDIKITLAGAQDPPAIEDVKLLNYTTEFDLYYDANNIRITHTGCAAKNKTYSLQFEVTLKDKATNEKPIKTTYSVKVK